MEANKMCEFNFWMASYKRTREICTYLVRCIRDIEVNSTEWIRCHRLLDSEYKRMLDSKERACRAFEAGVRITWYEDFMKGLIEDMKCN